MANSINIQKLAEAVRATDSTITNNILRDNQEKKEKLLADLKKTGSQYKSLFLKITDDQIIEFFKKKDDLLSHTYDVEAKSDFGIVDYLLREELKQRAQAKLDKTQDFFEYAKVLKQIKAVSHTVYSSLNIDQSKFESLFNQKTKHPNRLRKVLNELNTLKLPDLIKLDNQVFVFRG